MALSLQQRRKRGQILRKYKTKIQAARKRLSKRMASTKNINARALKAAKKLVRKRFAGKMGLNYDKLTTTQKIMIDKRLESKKGLKSLVDKLARRLKPQILRKERERLKKLRSNKKVRNEEFQYIQEMIINEKAPPDSEIENWIKKNKKRFIDEYGENGKSILYGKAWNIYNKKNK